MEQVIKLTTAEALAVKQMWSEIFFEDSQTFTDYYFAEKMKDNIGYGVTSDNALRAMLFLTPYTGRIYAPDREGRLFQDVPLYYIVGVGTQKEYRHRGYMDRLLRHCLHDMYESGRPFTFLMPADPAIYTPYQFRYIYDRPVFHVVWRGENRGSVMEAGEEEALARFAGEQLEARYHFYLKRDASYYRRQKKESLAQGGDIYLWKRQGEIAGFYLYAKENGKEEIQEAIVSKELAAQDALQISDQTRPVIMARITNAAAMLSLMRLKGQQGQTVTVTLKLSDPLIRENNGTFLWTVGEKESTIALLEKNSKAEVSVRIDALTEFIFGRKSSEECFDDMELDCQRNGPQGGVYERLSKIRTLSRSFINEIV